VRLPPPKLGEHTERLLAEAGYSPEEIAALESRGVVRCA
jgi:crotonobetainyl-CoA:carnitine CoA-transferase CaiB-like acyl-CoA transferase